MHTSTALTDNYDKFTFFKEIIAVFIISFIHKTTRKGNSYLDRERLFLIINFEVIRVTRYSEKGHKTPISCIP